MFTSAKNQTTAIKMIESFGVGFVLTALSYAIVFGLSYVAPGVTLVFSFWEALPVFLSYACTWLCVKQSRVNYPIGALACASYAYLFWTAGLPAQTWLNLYLIFPLVYGWFRWRNDVDTRPVKHVDPSMLPIYAVVTAATAIGAFILVEANGGGKMPYADIAVLALSILAQFLLDNKKIETWFVWALVNVIAIWLYYQAGLYLVTVQYVFFLANTVLGYVAWRKTVAKQFDPIANGVISR